MKVVQKLNGAHLLIPMSFPSKQGAPVSKSLAIRFYSPKDLLHLTSEFLDHEDDRDAERLDDLKRFVTSFALSLVVFVLPEETTSSMKANTESILVSELQNPNSWSRRAMHHLTTPTALQDSNGTSSSTCCCRLLVVPDAQTALEGIRYFADSLKPEKMALKQAFFRRQEIQHCIPTNSCSSQRKNEGDHSANDQQRNRYSSNHVRHAFSNWAHRFELPMGEEDVLMEMLGSLQSIATVQDDGVPMEDRTRQLLQSFFDLPESKETVSSINDTTAQQSNVLSQHQHSSSQEIPLSHLESETQRPTYYNETRAVASEMNPNPIDEQHQVVERFRPNPSIGLEGQEQYLMAGRGVSVYHVQTGQGVHETSIPYYDNFPTRHMMHMNRPSGAPDQIEIIPGASNHHAQPPLHVRQPLSQLRYDPGHFSAVNMPVSGWPNMGVQYQEPPQQPLPQYVQPQMMQRRPLAPYTQTAVTRATTTGRPEINGSSLHTGAATPIIQETQPQHQNINSIYLRQWM